MKKIKVFLIMMVLMIVVLTTVVHASGSSSYTFSFNIVSRTGGKNWKPFVKGNAKITVHGNTYLYDESKIVSDKQKYYVEIYRNPFNRVKTGDITANGVSVTKIVTIGSTADYYHIVTVSTSNPQPYKVKGDGKTKQTW